jgi:Cas6b C-terminal domain/Cas6b N-terminal domain
LVNMDRRAGRGRPTRRSDMEQRQIDRTSVGYELDGGLDLRHARWLRGAVAARAGRSEFHHHAAEGAIYRHPLIRYDVSTGRAVITGLGDGALLLGGMPTFETFQLGPIRHIVLSRSLERDRVPIGPTIDPIEYQFRSPYLALNQENHALWERGKGVERRELLERVVVGNLLSISKAVGHHVEERLRAEVAFEPDGWYELKPGVRLLGFWGTFRVNFTLPDGWGLGKSSARGFGTLIRNEA